MAKVTGLGGVFYVVKDPAKTRRWYAEVLGLAGEYGPQLAWADEPHEAPYSLISHFPDEEYIRPGTGGFMINLRVDDCDGMVKQWQRLFFDSRYSASDKSLHQKDFIKAAEADGYKFAVRGDHKEDLDRVVADFVAFEGPAFLEVIIDPDAGVYPMVGPGMSYDQMITGDFIADRNDVDPETPDSSAMF